MSSFFGCQVTVCGNSGQIEPARRTIEKRSQRGLVVTTLHRREIRQPPGFRTAAQRRENINDFATGDRPLRGLVPDDQPIAAQRADWPVEKELNQRRLTRLDLCAFQSGDSSGYIGRAQMDMYRLPMSEWLLFAFENSKARSDLRYWIWNISGHDPVAPVNQIVLQTSARQIERASLTCSARFRRPVLSVNGPDSSGNTGMQQANVLTDSDAAGNRSPRDDQARPCDDEAPVNGETKIAGGRSGGAVARCSYQVVFQRSNPFASYSGNRKNRCAFKRCSRQQCR